MILDKLQYPPERDKHVLTRSPKTALCSPLSRRDFLARWAALSVSPFVFASSNYAETMTTSETDAVVAAATPAMRQAAEDTSMRPFTVHVPQARLDELRRRIATTQWPEQ